MLAAARRLFLGLLLIAATSAVLLFSDWEQRQKRGGRIPRLAILQHVSQAVLDDTVQGALDALAEAGFIDGKTVQIQRFNAEGDLPTANAIARQITGGGFDYALTASTLSMQVVYNANQAAKVMHVFGAVANPFVSGVGLDAAKPLAHPRHFVGIGSFLPVAEAFKMARQMFPALKTVGVAWNPTEANSAAFTKQARIACQEMGLTLLEANADNSAGVAEAANSLIARGAQALWIGGDLTVLVAADSAIGAARKAKIPVFSIVPPSTRRGALFDLGANFHTIGKQTGELLAQIMKGLDPATVPIRNEIPRRLMVNVKALAGLKDPWRVPPEILARADVVIDEKGEHEKPVAGLPRPPPGRRYKLGLAFFAPEEIQQICVNGLFDGLKAQGFVEGQNLEVRQAHAQAEFINIPSMLQNFDSQKLDLIIAMTTPVLTAATTLVRNTPVVFTYVYDPIAAGAGRSRTDHHPNITGVGSFPPVAYTVDVIQKLVPGIRSVGTLYNSSEANSRKVVSVARGLFQKRGIRLEEVTITSTSEVYQAAQAVAARRIQLLWVDPDNTAVQGYDAIARVAQDARLPLVTHAPEFIDRGAVAAVGVSWRESGLAAGKLAARVLLGESPRKLPFEEVSSRNLALNPAQAQKLGIVLSPDLVEEARRQRR